MQRRHSTPDARASRAELRADDERLLAGVRAGDRSSTAELCRRLKTTIDGTLHRIVGRGDPEHRDLSQASFEQIVSSLERGKFSWQCSFSTWTAAITAHVALRAIRSRRLERRFFDRSLDGDLVALEMRGPNDPEAQVSARKELELTRRHLGDMSQKLSEALLLHDVLGFGLEETMALTGSSKVALQSRLTRARRELAERTRQMPAGKRRDA